MDLQKKKYPIALEAVEAGEKNLIPFHEKNETDVNHESLTTSKFLNCGLRKAANCELV